MYNQYDYNFKIVLLGSYGVGKTSILKRMVDNEFIEIYKCTVGIDFRFKQIILKDKIIKLQIWDTAGQQKFRAVLSSMYKGSQAVILVYDKNNLKSLQQIKQYWLNEVSRHLQKKSVVFIFANKYDDYQQPLNSQDEEYFTKKGFKIFKVSAKIGDSVKKAFQEIALKLMSIFPMCKEKLQQMLNNQKQSQINIRNKCCLK